MDTCKRCDGDGWIDIMDPDFAGAVIGARDCPDCNGTGLVSNWDEDPQLDAPAACPSCTSSDITRTYFRTGQSDSWVCESCEYEWSEVAA